MSNRRTPAPAPEDNDNVEQLREEIRRMQERLNSLPAASPRTEDPKVREPKLFDGKSPSQLPNFLAQVKLVFKAKPSAYPTEESKVIYAISFLDGPAFSYFQPYVDEKEPPSWMTDFASFADELKSVYGSPDVIDDLANKLFELKQTGPATEYAADFRRLGGQLDMPEPILVNRFFKGLKDDIQTELAKTDYPKTLNGIIGVAIRLDNLQQSRKVQPGQARLTSTPSTTPTTPTASLGQHLTPEEKELRYKNKQCLYCGSADHFVRSCPTRPQRPKGPPAPARASEAVFFPAGPQGNGSTQSL